uniref:Transposase Tc1-like domain-containing protein n=1 Tax=Xiphophorus couchianus TaxID=32473 RepID=A0A3B5KJ05_9TELE
MGFLRRVAGLSLRDRVRSSVIREELRVEPLLLHIERSQLRWLGHLVRMPPGRLPGEVFQARPTGRRPRGRPKTRWRDYVSRIRLAVRQDTGRSSTQIKAVTGADCSPITIRRHLREKGFRNKKRLQRPRLLQRHRIARLDFARVHQTWDIERLHISNLLEYM